MKKWDKKNAGRFSSLNVARRCWCGSTCTCYEAYGIYKTDVTLVTATMDTTGG